VGNKDKATDMDGEWVETKMRKMIYGAIAPRVKHPTLAKKTSVKLYSKGDMVHMMLQLKCVLPLLPKPRNILPIALFSNLFEGRSSTTNTRSHH